MGRFLNIEKLDLVIIDEILTVPTGGELYPCDRVLPSPPGPDSFDEDGHPLVKSFEARSSGQMSTDVQTAPLWVSLEAAS